MSRTDEDKWNLRYREGAYSTRRHPSAILEEWLPRLHIDSASPRALDIACGAGRNALYLARLGWHVDAIDISQVALDELAATAAKERLSIACTQADLETPAPLPAALRVTQDCDLTLMIRYTNLPLVEALRQTLAAGSYLMIELHLETDADVIGPRNPRFRVAPGALRAAAGGLDIVGYEEGLVDEPDGRRAALARLVARGV